MSRFVQFGADQVCFCGTPSCRQKLGNKPSKLMSSWNIFWYDEYAILYFCSLWKSESSSSGDQRRKSKNANCIGELVRVWLPSDKRFMLTLFIFNNLLLTFYIMLSLIPALDIWLSIFLFRWYKPELFWERTSWQNLIHIFSSCLFLLLHCSL